MNTSWILFATLTQNWDFEKKMESNSINLSKISRFKVFVFRILSLTWLVCSTIQTLAVISSYQKTRSFMAWEKHFFIRIKWCASKTSSINSIKYRSLFKFIIILIIFISYCFGFKSIFLHFFEMEIRLIRGRISTNFFFYQFKYHLIVPAFWRLRLSPFMFWGIHFSM